MNAATETVVEVDVDLDAQVPCDAEGCELPAAWVIHPPCGHPTLSCDPCRVRCDEMAAFSRASCQACGARVPRPLDWRPL